MRIRVWDLPTRVFHWAIVVCLVGSIATIKLSGDWMPWHFRFGYAALALILFRIVWGVVGPHYARFASFPPNVGAAFAYLRGGARKSLGHNPLGAFSVYALLLVVAVQAVGGLFANDAILWDGPWRKFVSGDTSDAITRLHKANEWVIYALVALHVLAVAWYALVRRETIVRPMFTGDREAEAGDEAVSDDGARVRMRGLLVFAAACGAVWAGVTLA